MAGLTPEGLSVKTLPEVISDLGATAQQVFADVVPVGEVVNVGDNSTLGRQIGVVAPSIADLWEAIQEIYDAFNPNAAEGISLDNLVALGAISRAPESRTKADVVVKGSTGVTIPVNSKVSSSTTGKVYSTNKEVSLDSFSAIGVDITLLSITNLTQYTVSYLGESSVSPVNITVTSGIVATRESIFSAFQSNITNNHPDLTTEIIGDTLSIKSDSNYRLFSFDSTENIGFVKVTKPAIVTCDEFGQIEQPTNTIDTIATPIFGWDSILNEVDAVPGSLVETDEQLRERFRNSKFERARSNYESITSATEAINGVEFHVLYENDTSAIDSRGIPPHSFLLIVEGGLDSDIADVVWKNKPAGIYSSGNTEVTIQDNGGYPQVVRFSRPVKVNVQVVINLSKYQDYPSDGDEQIKQEVIKYIESLKIGEQLTYSRLYTPINTVSGHEIEGLQIGLVGNPLGTTNIVPPFDGIVAVTPGNISIV